MRIVYEKNLSDKLFALYEQLRLQHGAMQWWPADTPFEVALGGILTQATSWRNVEKAFENLKAAGAWTPAQLRATPQSELEELLRPSRYYRAKAKKVRAFVEHIAKRPMHVMFEQSVPELREELLAIYGIGPETADTIILYAAEKPSFVVDAYTYRLFSRLGWLEGKLSLRKTPQPLHGEPATRCPAVQRISRAHRSARRENLPKNTEMRRMQFAPRMRLLFG